ncbi:MAG: crossover junction endodeoxyribonuclease RuvC [Actinomycetota bacterium]
MVILGLDPGTAATGWGVVSAEGSRLRSVDYGCIRTDAHTPPAERLAVIARALDELLERFQPDAVAVEEVYVGGNPRTALAVGQARGAALTMAGLRHIAVAEYTVSQIKTAVSGYGRADKRQVQLMVGAVLGLPEPPSPDHAADALAAAICHAGQGPLQQKLRAAGVRG